MNATATLINNDPIMTLRVLHAELDQVGNMQQSQKWLQTTEGENFLAALHMTVNALDPKYNAWLDTEAERYDNELQEVAPLCA